MAGLSNRVKTCGKCKVVKEAAEFAKNRNSSDGLQFCCKVCQQSLRHSKVVPSVVAKKCGRCGFHLPSSAFGLANNSPDGLQKWCRNCRAEHRDACRQENRTKAYQRYHSITPEERKAMHFRGRLKKYGLSEAEFWRIYKSQGGRCAICRNECPTGKELAIDHCHETGVVRGLLCINCNQLIGHAHDSPDVLSSAIEYLVARAVSA